MTSKRPCSPPWGRAKISQEWPSLFHDRQAVRLFKHIDDDFSSIDEALGLEGAAVQAAYAKQFDDKVRSCVARHPEASVVNLGAGLDTAFYRVDNGTLRWCDLDLPTVMALRSELLPAPERALPLRFTL
ncbi:MAG: class I SAM-dependent methyltransferase [Halobacteriota archaeon]